MSIVAVGDKYLITGLRFAGIKGIEVREEEAPQKIKELVEEKKYKIIIIPESYALKIKGLRNELLRKGESYPIFAVVPGFEGSKKVRLNELYQLINEAVGVKLKFEGE